MKKYVGMGAVYCSILIAGWLWIGEGKEFSVNEIGKLFGILGIVLMSWTTILGARIKFLEDYFYSLNKAYINHHLTGGASFLLILFHPVLLSIRYLNYSVSAAWEFFLPSQYMAKNFGIAAVWLMVGLMVLTLFVKIDYKKWHISHKFMSAVFILSVIHWMTIYSDVSENMILRGYLMLISSLGIGAIIYRTLLPGKLVKKYNYVVGKHKVYHQHLILNLKPETEKMVYKPGQFVFLEVFGESHPLSLSSNNDELELIIKINGDWTNKLTRLKDNDLVKVEGPYGKFGQNKSNDEEVWIAGGVGIVPFVALAKIKSKKKIKLFYSVKTNYDLIKVKELIKKTSDKFQVKFIESDKQGRLKAEQVLSNNPNTEYLLCGPTGMVENIKNDLIKLKVKPKKIISEEFFLK